MERVQYDRLIDIMGLCALGSLIINVPHMLGYSKIYQILGFGLASVVFMTLSFKKRVRELRTK